MRLKSTIVWMFVASAVACAACARDTATPPKQVDLFPDGASVAPGAKMESADFPAEPFKFYRFECRVRSPGQGFVAALWRNPDATWGRDLQGRPGDLRAEDYQLVPQSDDWHTVVFYSRAQANAVAGCLRVQALDGSMEIESASVTGPASAEEVLAWSDGLLGALPKGDIIVQPSDMMLMPRTVKAFHDAGTLRIVFLGDSIMQDAANSPVDLWLERDRPGLKVEIITAIGGGAGMERWNRPENFPQHDLNLKAAVIGQRPDLVLIGGISTNSVDDIRDVINRVREGAKAIEADPVDIVLMTGPFGDWKKSSVGLDAPKLAALATETGCGFLDLRFIWLDFLQRSGREPADFYRDPIHGSPLGKISQGRWIAAWLSAIGTVRLNPKPEDTPSP